MKLILFLVGLLWFHTCGIGDVAGQSDIHSGQLIRVTTDSARVIGSFAGRTDSVIWLLQKGEKASVAVSSIERLEISYGQKNYGGVGALLGTASGILISIPFMKGKPDCDKGLRCWGENIDQLEHNITTFLLGGVIGAATGVIIGSAIKSERWERWNLSAGTAVLPKHTNDLVPVVSLRVRLK